MASITEEEEFEFRLRKEQEDALAKQQPTRSESSEKISFGEDSILPMALGIGGGISGFSLGGPPGAIVGGAAGTALGRTLTDVISTGLGAKEYTPKQIGARALIDGAFSAAFDVATLGMGRVAKPLLVGGLQKIARGPIQRENVKGLIKAATHRFKDAEKGVSSINDALHADDIVTEIKNILPDIIDSGLKKKDLIKSSLEDIVEKSGVVLPSIKQDLQNVVGKINNDVSPIMNQAKGFFNKGYEIIKKKYAGTAVNQVKDVLDEIESGFPLIADLDSNFINAFNKIRNVAGGVMESGLSRGKLKVYDPVAMQFTEKETVKQIAPGITVVR